MSMGMSMGAEDAPESVAAFIGPRWVPVILTDEERDALVSAFLATPEYLAMRERDVERAVRLIARRQNVMDILCAEAIRRERAVLLREARMIARTHGR